MAVILGEAETSRNEHRAWTAACLAGQFVRHCHDLRGPSRKVAGDRGPRVTLCGGVGAHRLGHSDFVAVLMLNQDRYIECYLTASWARGGRALNKEPVMKKLISSCVFAVGLAMGLSACTDPYDPGQRAVGGGLFGAGTGAAIGGIAGGGRGAATGALIGGTLGALGGAATTPSSGYYGDGYSGYGSSGSGYNRYGYYGPHYYGSDYNGSGYDGAGYYGYGR